MAFKEIKIEELSLNPFAKISKEWMLITAGDEKKSNTMTASWGGLGIMWSKNVATAYIRPQRYTKEFVDNNEVLSNYDIEYSSDIEVIKDGNKLTITPRKMGEYTINFVHKKKYVKYNVPLERLYLLKLIYYLD